MEWFVLVVKELVENVIDVDSIVIEIDIEEVGFVFIWVLDNGEGMENEDCKCVFCCYVMSKIKDENDLFRVRMFGFRGEVLLSIVLVFYLEIMISIGEGVGMKFVF